MLRLSHGACVLLGVLAGWASRDAARWLARRMVEWLWPFGPLRLARPLVAFDIEATGLNVSKDRVLEIAAVKLLPSGKVEVLGPQRLNPGVPIPAEVTAIHGITQEDVAACPRFADVAAEWRDFLDGCDLLGFNAKKFDVPILRNEFRRCGGPTFPPLGVPVVDAFRLFCSQEPRSLGAAVAFYTGRRHGAEAAHSALGDAWATLRVLAAQLRRYPWLPRDTAALAQLCAAPSRAQDITSDGKFQWRGELPILAFGKYAGEPLAVLIARHKDHLRWMSGQDFSDESLLLIDKALQGLLPTRDGGWQPLFDLPPSQAAAGAAGPAAGQPPRQQQQQQQQGRGGLRQQEKQPQDKGAPQQQRQQQQQQQQQQQGQQQQGQQQLPADAARGGSAGADSSPVEPAAAPGAATGWPALDDASAPAAAAGADSWGAPPGSWHDAGSSSRPGSTGSGRSDGESATRSNRSPDGSPDGSEWAVLEPEEEAHAATLDTPNPEPQEPQGELAEEELLVVER